MSPADFGELLEEIKDLTGIRNHQELFPLLRLFTGKTDRALRYWLKGTRRPSAAVIRVLQLMTLVLRGRVRQEYEADGRIFKLQ